MTLDEVRLRFWLPCSDPPPLVTSAWAENEERGGFCTAKDYDSVKTLLGVCLSEHTSAPRSVVLHSG